MEKIIIPTTYKLPTEPRGHTIKAIYILAQVVQENNGTMSKISKSLKDIVFLKAQEVMMLDKTHDWISQTSKNRIDKLLK